MKKIIIGTFLLFILAFNVAATTNQLPINLRLMFQQDGNQLRIQLKDQDTGQYLYDWSIYDTSGNNTYDPRDETRQMLKSVDQTLYCGDTSTTVTPDKIVELIDKCSEFDINMTADLADTKWQYGDQVARHEICETTLTNVTGENTECQTNIVAATDELTKCKSDYDRSNTDYNQCSLQLKVANGEMTAEQAGLAPPPKKSSGSNTLLIIGGALVVGYLFLRKKKDIGTSEDREFTG